MYIWNTGPLLASLVQGDTNLLTHTILKPVFIHPYKSTALAVSDQHPWWVQGQHWQSRAIINVGPGGSTGSQWPAPLWVQGAALAVSDQHHYGSRGQHWQSVTSTIMGPGGSTGSQWPVPLWVQGTALAARSSTTVDPGGSTSSKGQHHWGSRGQH